MAPYFACFFALMMENAQIPEMSKAAKVTPLHKRGPVLDPNNYCMLAASGTMYRLYVNVLRVYVPEWCQKNNKIPDTQFGFYPGRNTLQPMFILRRLLHAAQTKNPYGSPRFVCLLQDASGHSNVLKAGKAEELKNARKRRTARKAN